MHALFLVVAAAAQAFRPAPSVPPVGAVGQASVRILSAVEVGAGRAAPAQSHQASSAFLRLADGSTRPALLTEFE